MAELTKAFKTRVQSFIALRPRQAGVWLAAVALCLLSCVCAADPAYALNARSIAPDQDRIDLSLLSEIYIDRGDHLSIDTATGADNIAGRMSIPAKTPGTNPNWMVFALNNPTDQTVTLWLMAPRYNLPGSKMIWPDLDAPRIANVTVSVGFKPERIDNDFADVYKFVLEPGATVTYIVELASVTPPRLYLASPSNFAKRALDITLFDGILLGITVVLALYLTAIFGVNHNSIFPAAAIFAWGVVAYLCVDFGFWHKLFKLNPENNAIYRAATEAAIVAGALIFLFVFLRLRHWYKSLTWGFVGWIVVQLSFIAMALLYPQEASGMARLSYVPLAAVGSALILFLALRGQERALSLLPTWMLFLVWMFGVAVTIMGKMSGEVVVSSLNAGLVLIVALLSFTVTQYAFNSGETIYGEDAGHLQLQVLALEASGASVWEWDIRRDDIFVGPDVDASLGYAPGTLRGKAEDWLQHLHASDRERIRLMLAAVREQQSGEITSEFRLRRADGTHLWYELRAQAVTSRQSKQLRCAGLMRDITGQKRSQESLLHNAIYDSLTGLPNRELFLDRTHCAIASVQDENTKPTILLLDIDTFKTLNRTTDITVSDSMLLNVSRRLARHLGPQDTLARVGAEQFGVLISTETEPRHIALLAERVRRSLRAPIKLGGQDIVLSGSIGIAVYDGQQSSPADLLREAEIAMFRAKRSGTDRIELYKPEMRREPDDRESIETGLRQAIEKRQIRVLYQPVMRLGDDELAGFEAQMRWEHPKLGSLAAAEFMSVAEETGLINELSTYVMERVARQVSRWHRALPREEDPLFVAMNISSRHLFKQELVQELRLILGRESVPKGCLRLEVTESLIMENPEQAIEVLDLLKSLGAGLSLDEFGAGYSSLAYLHRLAVDTIKIDRLLVAHGNDNKSGAVVLRAALAMARELGKDVVAVGIEREDDVAYVRALGCDYAQGLYFGEAMNEREAMQLINAIAKSGKREKKKKKSADAIAGAGPVDADPSTSTHQHAPQHPQQIPPQAAGPYMPNAHQQQDPHYPPHAPHPTHAQQERHAPHSAQAPHAPYPPQAPYAPQAPHAPHPVQQAGAPDMGERHHLPISAPPPSQTARPAPRKKSGFIDSLLSSVGLSGGSPRPKEASKRRKPRQAPPPQQKASPRDQREPREARDPRDAHEPREARGEQRGQRPPREPREQRGAREPKETRDERGESRKAQQQPQDAFGRPPEMPQETASSSLRGKLTQLDAAKTKGTSSKADASSKPLLSVQVISPPSAGNVQAPNVQASQQQDDSATGA